MDDVESNELRHRRTEMPSPASVEPTPPPSRLGEYRIIRQIDSGGMGIVYEAVQERAELRVALKVIKPGYMSAEMLRRFEYEGRLLARLQHPGIARIHHAGVSDSGLGPQPFFAMEFVEGKTLDEFVKSHAPPLKVRALVELFSKICQAVQHAHSKGVVHRDLKPGNILVTADGSPKILDFGIARAVDADTQAVTLHTESGAIVGTVPYMAPEQVRGEVNELDEATDVYALGVIGYELIGGRMPYPVKGRPLPEAARMICEDEPSRLSSINKSLRGDVETIVQKALEKDKTRRYHTAGELAADVKRYLEYEPITARPPGTWYQLTKFARRNKLVVSGVALLIVVLAAGVITSTWFAVRATRQEHEAKTQAEIAQAVSDFLTERVLPGARPERIPDKSIRDAIVQAMLDPAAADVAKDFKDKPGSEAAVRNGLALSYDAIGRPELAFPHAQIALALRRRVLGDDHPSTLISMDNMARLLGALGEWEQAEPLYREALERRRRVLGVDHAQTLASINAMGSLLQARGKLDQAEPLLHEAVERSRRVLGNQNPDTLAAINNMGHLLQAQGKLEQAEPLTREALMQYRRILGNDNPDTLTAINNQAFVLQSLGKLDEAEPLYREALEHRRRVLGDEHPDTLYSINNMGFLLLAQQKLDRAEPLLREALECRRRKLGDDNSSTLISMNNMARLLQEQGKLDQAELLFGDALERSRRVLGADHWQTLISLNNMAALLEAEGKLQEAEPLDAELYHRTLAAQLPPKQAALLLSRYGPCLVKLGRHADAAEPLRVAYERLKETEQMKHPQFKAVLQSLVEVARATGQSDTTDAMLRREIMSTPGPATSPATTQTSR